MAVHLLRRIYWRLLRAVGMERLSWDRQYESGALSRPRSPHTVARVVELCAAGRLVDFGCGEGELPLVLPEHSFSDYIGYDISEVAVQRAREFARKAGRPHLRFEQGDMAKWQGVPSVSLVVIEECLYYLTNAEIESFLTRCCECLVAGGSILVIVHSAAKHAQTLDACRRVCRVTDESLIGGRTYLTLAVNG